MTQVIDKIIEAIEQAPSTFSRLTYTTDRTQACTWDNSLGNTISSSASEVTSGKIVLILN